VYAGMTTTQGTDEDMVAIAAMAGETMDGWLRELEGFRGLLVLSSGESGITQVLTLWESKEVAERHQASRMRLRDLITGTVGVEVLETASYEVAFADLPTELRIRSS
jgi:heme-degrading monooxygenase HmoA